MNKFLNLSDIQRRNVFESVAAKVDLPAQVIEKDFWVTAIIQIIFALPMAKHLVFKGGTSLSKGWKLIERFSEDIDLAIDPTEILGSSESNPTKKQIKKLRKVASLFVSEQFYRMIYEMITRQKLESFINVKAQSGGIGDNTYPEPRQIYIRYKSVFGQGLDYLRPDIVLEVSARSLLEPTEPIKINSIIGDNLPIIPIEDSLINAATPAKTFLEKAFLLHEIFSVSNNRTKADRKSRHLYDLHVMMNKDFAVTAIKDDELWNSILHHRKIYTSVKGVDYTPDVRNHIQLLPCKDSIDFWRSDYDAMKESMIYGNKPSFDELLTSMEELQERFRRSNKDDLK